MDDGPILLDDLSENQPLLLAALKQAPELEHVLNETAASCQDLRETHQATLGELHRLKRWTYGGRSERMIESDGQPHLFDPQQATTDEEDSSVPEPPAQQVNAHSGRRRRPPDLD